MVLSPCNFQKYFSKNIFSVFGLEDYSVPMCISADLISWVQSAPLLLAHTVLSLVFFQGYRLNLQCGFVQMYVCSVQTLKSPCVHEIQSRVMLTGPRPLQHFTPWVPQQVLQMFVNYNCHQPWSFAMLDGLDGNCSQ